MGWRQEQAAAHRYGPEADELQSMARRWLTLLENRAGSVADPG
jgi:hypothetical protein